jgi:hypothetical protein
VKTRVLWLLAAAIACSPSLPSAEPLGAGPMADRGDATVIAKSDSGSAPDASLASAPEPPPEPPPVVASGSSDAGADAAGASAPPSPKDGGAPASAATASVAGEYVGWDTTTYKVPNLPEAPQRDPKARTRVVKGAGDAIEIVIINSANGSDLCSVKGKLKAGTATLDKGQRCFEEGNGMMTATLRKGTAKFSGKQLDLDIEFDLTVDTGQDKAKGDILYHFEGTRK